jgi:SAM-dependent methyltransferase
MNDFQNRAFRSLADFIERSPFCQRLLGRVLMNSTVLPAKIYPFAEDAGVWWTTMTEPAGAARPDELPIPPVELWEGYGKTPRHYLESGRHDIARMLEILSGAGFAMERTGRILDFGCSAGRMIRWLTPYAADREIWGVDIAAKPVHWAMQNLSPPLYFATNTTLPPLPFEAGSFDLIYCGSVFTHIAELADLWLLELRRLLRPGGFLYATIHDKCTLRLLAEKYPDAGLARAVRAADEETGCLRHNFAKLVVARSPKGAQVFYDLEYLRRHWGRLFEFVSVTEEAYGYQTALVLRKKQD